MSDTMPQLNPDAVQMLNWMASYKDAGTTPGAPLHGPGGLLSTPGMSRTIVNAMIMPRGLAGRLPVRKSVDTNEVMGILTGLTAESGSLPTTQCAAWPLAGQFKICRQTHPFGQQGMDSQVLNAKYAGQIVNRGEFRDNVLLGSPNMDGNKTIGPVNWQKALQTEYEKKIAELYASYWRYYARYTYTGNPALTAGSQGFMQYRGLDLLINTGKRDAITGVACPAADSLVLNLNGASLNSSGGTIYALLANMVNNLERLAEQLNLEVKWALVMRYGAFTQATAIWPCIYATTRCTDGVVRTSSLEEQVKIRDAMRKGRYLTIEGKDYDVIIDDSIAEEVAAGGVVGTYESDFYFVPLTANGEPVTYWEYFDFNAEAIAAANRLAPSGYFETVDNGRYLLVKLTPTHTCVQVEVLERPRLVLMMPFLAAKIQNVRYTYSIHERDVFVDETYFVNGGLTVSPNPYFYPNATGG
jgi:hypothetical protein